jgi:hypothetical protein
MASLVPVEQCVITSFLMACECAFLSAVARPFLSSARTNQFDQLGSDLVYCPSGVTLGEELDICGGTIKR